MEALVRNWWMIAVRGGLAVVFGLVILAWPDVTLPVVVVLFGAYAVLDGLWALAAAIRASRFPLQAWPVAAEGLVSIVLGVLALDWPFVSREFIRVIAAWGVLTGLLEVVAAAQLRHDVAEYWLLGTGGVSSLFLAIFVVLLPHADVGAVVMLLAIYALLFGLVVSLAAVRFHHGHARRHPARRLRLAR